MTEREIIVRLAEALACAELVTAPTWLQDLGVAAIQALPDDEQDRIMDKMSIQFHGKPMPRRMMWGVKMTSGDSGWILRMAFAGIHFGDGEKPVEFNSEEAAWKAIRACDFERLGYHPAPYRERACAGA